MSTAGPPQGANSAPSGGSAAAPAASVGVPFPATLSLAPARHAEGTVALPGSKSISNRTLLLAALAHGTTTLTGLLESDDTKVMLDALRALGIDWRDLGDNRYEVPGAGGPFAVKEADLFLGLSGLSMRTLVAALALSGGRYRVDGVPRMRERPIGDLVDALRPLGAAIAYESAAGFPPLRIEAGRLAAVPVRIRGDVSSQFLTGLLQALPLLHADVTVTIDGELISRPYVEITLDLMQRFGVAVERDAWRSLQVRGGNGYRSPGTLCVEGDASGASYFLAAGVLGGGPVRVTGVGRASIQGDVAFADELARLGAGIRFGPDWIEARAGSALRGGTIDCVAIPDAAMTLAITALFADAPTTLTNIGSWRVKETDRIAAMATELRKLGATVDEGPDWLRVAPPARWAPATIATYDDHRMAMCFALATFGGVPVTIADPGCVRKTYPGYFTALRAILT
jgi:3-phosphoshikimate 1-carboxyvinyltransferase